jgi:hypothetical protein
MWIVTHIKKILKKAIMTCLQIAKNVGDFKY